MRSLALPRVGRKLRQRDGHLVVSRFQDVIIRVRLLVVEQLGAL